LGDGLISIMDRGGWSTEGAIMIRTSDGNLVSQATARRQAIAGPTARCAAMLIPPVSA